MPAFDMILMIPKPAVIKTVANAISFHYHEQDDKRRKQTIRFFFSRMTSKQGQSSAFVRGKVSCKNIRVMSLIIYAEDTCSSNWYAHLYLDNK
ncbi:hypothetical protein CDAR_440021 [Caerostris darwini]|uniref:Uncharacterized protein n=1 Tax=Caerostris darwini TaxID=1538125 RepID=A0AAV4SN71_9ARAC|nr:hypothetical protein CDAR_440021 [Caerostris darwini]